MAVLAAAAVFALLRSRAVPRAGQYAHNHGVLSNHAPDGGFDRLDSDNTAAAQ